MARREQVEPSTEALCRHDEFRYCARRVNARRTPGGEGQCELQLRGRGSVARCNGRIFFQLSPDRAAKYRGWVLSPDKRPLAPGAGGA